MVYFRVGLILLYIKRLIYSVYSLRTTVNNLGKSEVFFFTHGIHIQTPGHTGLVGDKYEYWLKQAEASGIQISHILNPFAPLPMGKCQRRNILIEFSLLIPSRNPLPKKELEDLLFREGLKNSIRNRILFRIYSVTISRFKPKIILGMTLPPILCLAANLHGVKTAEFQHGVGYKEEFDFQAGRMFSPDLMLMWHDVYSDAAQIFGRKSLTVGFPIADESLQFSMSHIGVPLAEARVLFTLSYLVPNSSDQFGYIHNEIAEAIELLIGRVKKVTLRLHPAIEADLELIPWRHFKQKEVMEELERQFPTTNVEFSSSKGLSQSLKEHDLHISYKSSSVFEASILGVPSILFSQDDLKLLLPEEVSTNNLLCYSSLHELVSNCESMLNSRKVGIANSTSPYVISELLYDWTS